MEIMNLEDLSRYPCFAGSRTGGYRAEGVIQLLFEEIPVVDLRQESFFEKEAFYSDIARFSLI